MNDVKKKIVQKIIGILLVICAFLINKIYLGRILLLFIGIIYLLFATVPKKDYKKYFLYFLLYFVILFVFDTSLVFAFKRKPVFSYLISSNSTKIYNGIGYRVWECSSDDIFLDFKYQHSYMCNEDDIELSTINAIASDLPQNYDEYKNQFIKVEGKISAIDGINSLDMQAYEETEVKTNGYVSFFDNIVFRYYFKENNEELSNFELYDKVIILGRVKSLQKEQDKTIVEVVDCLFINTTIYDEFDINLISRDLNTSTPNVIFEKNDLIVYSKYPNNIMLKFSEDDIYELEFAISSSKMDINEMLEYSLSDETFDDVTCYMFQDFKLYLKTEDGKQIVLIDEILSTFESIENYEIW